MCNNNDDDNSNDTTNKTNDTTTTTTTTTTNHSTNNNHNNNNNNSDTWPGSAAPWAAPFIPIPLPEKVLQTSNYTILLYKFVLQTGLGMGMGINGTVQYRGRSRVDEEEVQHGGHARGHDLGAHKLLLLLLLL